MVLLAIGHQLLIHIPLMPIYASVNSISIGSENGLPPIRHQAIV